MGHWPAISMLISVLNTTFQTPPWILIHILPKYIFRVCNFPHRICDPRCPMGCRVQCGPAAPVCVETDASSWRGFLLWTHSSPGLLGCFRVVYTVQYSVHYTLYSTTMPGLSAELGPMNGWSGDLATSYLVTLCWIVLKMGNLVSARNYRDHFHSTVQHNATHTLIHCSRLLW